MTDGLDPRFESTVNGNTSSTVTGMGPRGVNRTTGQTWVSGNSWDHFTLKERSSEVRTCLPFRKVTSLFR